MTSPLVPHIPFDLLYLRTSTAISDSATELQFADVGDVLFTMADFVANVGIVYVSLGELTENTKPELSYITAVDTGNNTITIHRQFNVASHPVGTVVRGVITSLMLSYLASGLFDNGDPSTTVNDNGNIPIGQRYTDQTTADSWVYHGSWDKVGWVAKYSDAQSDLQVDNSLTFHLDNSQINHDALPINTKIHVASDWSGATTTGDAFSSSSFLAVASGKYSWVYSSAMHLEQLELGDILVIDTGDQRYVFPANGVPNTGNPGVEYIYWTSGPFWGESTDYLAPGQFAMTLVRPSALSDTTTTFTCDDLTVKVNTLGGQLPPAQGGGLI